MKSVLIIDDDERTLRALTRAVREHFVVTRSTSVGDAIGLIDSGKRYDVILCDMFLGKETGRELYDRLLARSSAQAARVLFISGAPPATDTFGIATLHRFMQKPVRVADLVARLAHIAGAESFAA